MEFIELETREEKWKISMDQHALPNSVGEAMKPWGQEWLIAAEAFPGFFSMKRLEVFLLPWTGCKCIAGHPPPLPANC